MRWFSVIVAAAAVWFGHLPQAAAQHWSVHGVGSLVTGFTDNVRNDAEPPDDLCAMDPGNAACPDVALYNQIAPSVLFTFESPRTVHVTSLGIALLTYYDLDGDDDSSPPPTTINGTLAHNSLFTTSQTTEVGLGASAGVGRVDAVLGGVDEQGGLQAQTAGATEFRSVGLNQSFRWGFARDWRFNQGTAVNQVNTSLENATNPDMPGSTSVARNLNVSLGLDRSWARTGVGLNANGSYVTVAQRQGGITNCADDPTQCTDTTQLVTNVAVNVRRDLSPRWSGNLQLGVATLVTLEATGGNAGVTDGQGTTTVPSGTLAVNYFRPLGTVTMNVGLSVGQSIAPNLLLGTTTQSTGGTITGSIPLPWFFNGPNPTVRVATSGGLIYSRVLDETTDVPPSWYAVTADVSAAWTPSDAWDVSLRYQFFTQIIDQSGDMALNPDPPEFARNTILLQVGGRWPTRQAATLPDRRQLRVDRANENPTGDERQSVGGESDDNPNRL